jgi:hypothetical protein
MKMGARGEGDFKPFLRVWKSWQSLGSRMIQPLVVNQLVMGNLDCERNSDRTSARLNKEHMMYHRVLTGSRII